MHLALKIMRCNNDGGKIGDDEQLIIADVHQHIQSRRYYSFRKPMILKISACDSKKVTRLQSPKQRSKTLVFVNPMDMRIY